MQRPVISGNPLSPHVRALVFALAEKDLPCTVQGPGNAQPVLHWGGHRVEGGLACLRHVNQTLPHPALEPADGAARDTMNRALDLYYGEAVVTLGSRVAAPYLVAVAMGTYLYSMRESDVEAALHTVGKLEELLGKSLFFGGDALSLADVAISSLYEPLSAVPEFGALVTIDSPLRGWFKRVSSRSAFDLTRQTGGSITSLVLATA